MLHNPSREPRGSDTAKRDFSRHWTPHAKKRRLEPEWGPLASFVSERIEAVLRDTGHTDLRRVVLGSFPTSFGAGAAYSAWSDTLYVDVKEIWSPDGAIEPPNDDALLPATGHKYADHYEGLVIHELGHRHDRLLVTGHAVVGLMIPLGLLLLSALGFFVNAGWAILVGGVAVLWMMVAATLYTWCRHHLEFRADRYLAVHGRPAQAAAVLKIFDGARATVTHPSTAARRRRLEHIFGSELVWP